MPLPGTALTALSVEPTSPPGAAAGASGRLARSQMDELPLAVCSPRRELAALDGGRVGYAFSGGSAVPNVDGETS